MDVSDTSWSRCREDWERLRWARKRAGFTQETFAARVGLQRGAYLKYEAPGSGTAHTPLKFEQARPWAKALKIRWEWLLEGQGTPWPSETKAFSPEAESVADLIDQAPAEERPELVAAIKTLLKRVG